MQAQGGPACLNKDGLLSKYRNFLLGWGVRYIKLDRSYLHNFEAKDAPNPAGSIVRGEIVRVCINVSFKGAAGPNVFDIVCRNGTTWYLKASSWAEMADWMICIWPNSRTELDRLSAGTSQAVTALPPPLIPLETAQSAQPGVCEGDPPPKNPNAKPGAQDGSGSSTADNGGSSTANSNGYQPPSYADLFDRHDPAKLG